MASLEEIRGKFHNSSPPVERFSLIIATGSGEGKVLSDLRRSI